MKTYTIQVPCADSVYTIAVSAKNASAAKAEAIRRAKAAGMNVLTTPADDARARTIARMAAELLAKTRR